MGVVSRGREQTQLLQYGERGRRDADKSRLPRLLASREARAQIMQSGGGIEPVSSPEAGTSAVVPRMPVGGSASGGKWTHASNLETSLTERL